MASMSEVYAVHPEVVFVDRSVGDPEVRRPDITRTTEILGWQPRVSLEEGLARRVVWFRERGPAGRPGGAT